MSDRSPNIELLMNVSLALSVELGRAILSIRDIVELGTGSVVQLDTAAGGPVSVLVNGKPIARGEIVALDDRFGVRITELCG